MHTDWKKKNDCRKSYLVTERRLPCNPKILSRFIISRFSIKLRSLFMHYWDWVGLAKEEAQGGKDFS